MRDGEHVWIRATHPFEVDPRRKPSAMATARRRWLALYRDALRAAKVHEGKQRHLVAMLPQYLDLAEPGRPPEVLEAVRKVARQAKEEKGAVTRALDAATRLRANLRRDLLYEDKRRRVREREPHRPHANLAWYLRKFDLVARRAPGTEPPSVGPRDELEVIEEMLQVACHPPRRMLEAAVQGLAASPLAFDRAIEAAWIIELRSPYVMAPESVASLVRGAMSRSGKEPWRAKQAMQIWRAYLECGAAADRGLGSLAVATAASAARSVEDVRGVEETMQVASEKGVQLNDTARMGILEAYERSGQYEKAFACMKTMNVKAQTPSAEVLLGLLDWAVHKGQSDRIEFIHDILTSSGKGKYLAAMSSPTC